jgi:hypothetical protein
MKTFALFLGLCGLAIGWASGSLHATAEAAETAAAAAPPDGSVLVLSDETRAKCDAEGGRRLISLQSAHELIQKQAKKIAGNCAGVAKWEE